MLRWLWSLVPAPDIPGHLLRDEGEVIVDEVAHHWVVYVRPVLEALAAAAVFGIFLFSPLSVGWLFLLIFVGLAWHAVWYALDQHMDRFVITNMRVFRVNGVVSRHVATVPISRILDMSVIEPVLGRLLGYGHVVFQSAAREQGLRKIRYIGRPGERDLTIQRVVQRSGVRDTVPAPDVP